MDRNLALLGWIVVVAGALIVGCDTPADPLKLTDAQQMRGIEVDSNDSQEIALVKTAEAARYSYGGRLGMLEAYYRQSGNLMKLNWTQREQANLADAQYFTWRGITVVPSDEAMPTSTDENLLVEAVVGAREDWLAAIDDMAEYFAEANKPFKAAAAVNVHHRFDPIRAYVYFRDAEMPEAGLKPGMQTSPEIEQLYRSALELHRQGKGVLHVFVTTDYDKQRQALEMFKELVWEHPSSPYVALAAYYIADIYKEYFREYQLALWWYERSWQWDPLVPEPARFQAATIYDRHLPMPDKAVELYRLSMEHDPWRLANEEWAKDRIANITGQTR